MSLHHQSPLGADFRDSSVTADPEVADVDSLRSDIPIPAVVIEIS